MKKLYKATLTLDVYFIGDDSFGHFSYDTEGFFRDEIRFNGINGDAIEIVEVDPCKLPEDIRSTLPYSNGLSNETIQDLFPVKP
jgi:hypothetical protein